ncbi:MAG: hypothetical protein ABIW03_06930 [Sphingomicrobium sp.]
MFENWHEFYLLAGSAAAVLIGLIFVVVTLMSDRPRSSVLEGSRLYMGPVVLHVSFVLALSAAALAPGIRPAQFALVASVIALWGLMRAVMSIAGIRAAGGEEPPHWTDVWFYGAVPAALYLAMAVVAFGFWSETQWAAPGVAAVVTGLLLISVRNEWDLVTWLAPRPDGDGDGA